MSSVGVTPGQDAGDVANPGEGTSRQAKHLEGRNESTMVWTPEELESLRLCRNRAYHKANSKRRQHLPASLSSFTLREWIASHPRDKFSAKYIIGIYNKHYEQSDRARKRSLGRKRRVGPANSSDVATPPDGEGGAARGVVSMENHSDKQWTSTMLETLTSCGERAQGQLGSGDTRDFSAVLMEEWLACYPNSTLTARNLKSRLTVYQRTRSEAPPPSKRKKFDDSGATSVVVSQRQNAELAPAKVEEEVGKAEEEVAKAKPNEDEGAKTEKGEGVEEEEGEEEKEHAETEALLAATDEILKDSNNQDIDGQVKTDVVAKEEPEEGLENMCKDFVGTKEESVNKCESATCANSTTTQGPEAAVNDVDPGGGGRPDEEEESCSEPNKENWKPEEEVTLKEEGEAAAADEKVDDEVGGEVDDPKLLDEVHDEFAPDSSSNEAVRAEDNSDWACEKHWMHMFRDEADKETECRLTEELLQIRERLKSVFQGCDVYQVKKPKGFSVAALREWQSIYPRSEENIKSISVKFSKYDKKFEKSFDDDDVADVSRSTWSPAMINALQKSRRLAEQKAGDNPTAHMLTRKWKEEWKRFYPKLDLDWKIVVGQYNSHFGSFDVFNDSSRDGSDRDGDDVDGKVKGFRNWTAKTKLDLLETHRKILGERPDLEPGSSDYNKLLLQEFQQLHPKCMESSRSIYSKVQSVEKEFQNGGGPRIGMLALPPVRGRPGRAHSDEDLVVGADQNGREGRTYVADGGAQQTDKDEGGGVLRSEGDVLDIAASLKENSETTANGVSAASRKHRIEGFEEWKLTMIKDFIACMDSTRRKFASLKEKDPGGNVKLVPLLLEEWKNLYPNTQETVKTFLVKIKHLKQQKDLIKKSLCQAGLLPKMEGGGGGELVEEKKRSNSRSNSGDGGNEFKWHKSMIDDVISSRKRALELKEQGMKKGKKLSFHQLWAGEFKKIYPNSTFTSNNLSVHLWTWRKQQQRMGKGDPMYDEAYSLADNSRPHAGGAAATSSSTASSSSSTHWNSKLKLQLLELGRKVQASLSDPETPNEQKVLGFSNMLHEEWTKLHPRRNDTARALNMVYCRVIKEGVDLLDSVTSAKGEKKKSTWTPRCNRVLRECMDVQNSLSPVSYSVYSQKVIEQWRRHFPKARESDETLKQRIADLTSSRDDLAAESAAAIPLLPSLNSTFNGKYTSISVRKVSTESNEKTEEAISAETVPEQNQGANSITRAPNSRGQMCWNKQTIRDLFQCHQIGLAKRQRSLSAMSKKEAPILSTLVHEEFLKLHPYCKLTPAILMAKLYCWKNALNKGTLNLEMTPQDDFQVKQIKEETELVLKKEPVEEASAPTTGFADVRQATNSNFNFSKDIVYRTWSQEMMDNLVKTRKLALARKQKLLEQGKLDVQLLDIWYEEFLKLHPDYKSTKKNLMQKFKWYRARMKKLNGAGDGARSAEHLGVAHATAPLGSKQNVKKELLLLPQQQLADPNPIRIRNVRKDVYLHIKALMEESRIFLPMKLPQEPELKQEFLATIQPLAPTSGLASHHLQQAQPQPPPPPPPPATSAATTPIVGPVAALAQQQPLPFILAQAVAASGAQHNPPPPFIIPATGAANHSEVAEMDQTPVSHALAQMQQKALAQEFPSVLACPPEPPPLTISVTSAPPAIPMSSSSSSVVDKADMPLNLTLPAHIKQQSGSLSEEGVAEATEQDTDKKDAIKLPGGATLVAVTDRNADALLKPKPVEKPHVTITIGEKLKMPSQPSPSGMEDQQQQQLLAPQEQQNAAIKQQPIVLSIPKFSMRNHVSPQPPHPPLPQQPARMPHQVQQPPPLPQLKPFGIDTKKTPQLAILPVQQQHPIQQQQLQLQQQQQHGRLLGSSYAFTPRAIFIPSRVKARLDEHQMTDLQFIQLLGIYEKARNEYIDTLKRGYLAFFPYILGSHWKRQVANSLLTGRKLALIVDLYVEEKNKGRIVTPEYLTKKPCQFVITEQMLKQVLVSRAEVVRDLEQKSRKGEVNSAIANVELCKRWASRYPEMKMTAKQLISIHEMLTYDTSKCSASPEIECTLSDVWKLMEKNVSRVAVSLDAFSSSRRSREAENEVKYDEETVTVDQMQEWLLETQGCPVERPEIVGRPHYAVKNLLFHWSKSKLEDLEDCLILGIAKWRLTTRGLARKSLRSMILSEWRKRHPDDKAPDIHVLGRCIRTIRLSKRKRQRWAEKKFARWRRICEDFSKSEDHNQVIVEEQPMLDEDVAGSSDIKGEGEDVDPVFTGRLTSLSKIASLQIASNTKRNFHNDEDVLSYIGEVQRLGKGNHPITWTPDVIRDLMRARQLARTRKREWEAWATKEYGGIGFAYNNPDVKNVKVDDMFKEEWCKLRPEMSSLSIWTLVSYARKYDNLKKQLILDNGQANLKAEPSLAVGQESSDAGNNSASHPTPEKKPFHINVFFENSSIPKFDLEELDKLLDVPQELKDLLRTRQLAKMRQCEQKVPMSLTELWTEEWGQIHPEEAGTATGLLLQRRLWALERAPGNVAFVSPALLRSTATEKVWPSPQEDEAPRVPPRKNVFVEDPEDRKFGVSLRLAVPSGEDGLRGCKGGRKKTQRWIMHFSMDVYTATKRGLVVPALEKEEEERDWEDDEEEDEEEDRTTLPAKTMLMWKNDRTLDMRNDAPVHATDYLDKFHCNTCTKDFHNINNFVHHQYLHGHREDITSQISQPSQNG